MRLHVAIQMDALAKLDPEDDSTIALLRAAVARGHAVFVYQPVDLRYESDGAQAGVWARGRWVIGWPEGAVLPALGDLQDEPLAQMQLLLMRQDPPFDMAYITATYLLELLPPSVWCINAPRAVRDAPEKIFIARYPALMPPTLIGNDCAAIAAFRAQHGALVLKPLYAFGGADIQLWRADDDMHVLEDYCAAQQGLPFVAQQFLPEVAAGDKRVLLLDGAIVGSVNRVPPPGDFLANLSLGGTAAAIDITPDDAALIAPFAQTLNEMGIFLAGVDIIGGKVTEINVTCPSTMIYINQVNGLTGGARMEERFWDAVANRLGRTKPTH